MLNAVSLSKKNDSGLFKNGYVILDFENKNHIYTIQEEIKSVFGFDPTLFHQQKIDDAERLLLVKTAKDIIVQKEFVKSCVLANAGCFTTLLGPDIDIQSDIYLRVSRPNHEGDFINWHRDTFYGNSHWELNFWLPIFPLEEGAGLLMVDGSHSSPADNVRHVEEQNIFRKQVIKGSLANELGYLYAPKSDDVIDSIAETDSSKIKLLTPRVGQAVFFFAHCVHRAQNLSSKTRVSIDVRIKHMLASTNTKPGYYQPLIRGDIAQYVEKMQAMEKGVFCGN